MSIEHAVTIYAVIFLIIIAPMIWLLMRRRAQKRAARINATENRQSPSMAPSRQAINWSGLFAFRPQTLLTGEMWLESVIVALVALGTGVIIIIYVFPLGALWAAIAAFVAVVVIVSLTFSLLD